MNPLPNIIGAVSLRCLSDVLASWQYMTAGRLMRPRTPAGAASAVIYLRQRQRVSESASTRLSLASRHWAAFRTTSICREGRRLLHLRRIKLACVQHAFPPFDDTYLVTLLLWRPDGLERENVILAYSSSAPRTSMIGTHQRELMDLGRLDAGMQAVLGLG